MTFVSILVILLAVWSVIWFIDTIFKSCMLYPYLMLLERNKIAISFGRVQWYTVRWNRALHRFRHYKPHFIGCWFNIGAFVVCLLLIPAHVIVLKTLLEFLPFGKTATKEVQSSVQVLEPVVPGINLPTSELPYYFLTILLSSIIHELGHAIAAVREDVRIQGFGGFIFFVFPGAYVDLPTDQMLIQPSWNQLKIFCAGVWHNLITLLLAGAALASLPVMLMPVSHQGMGVTVVHVEKTSGLSSPTGLFPEDVVTHLDSCRVTNLESWKLCLVELLQRTQVGYCVGRDFVAEENIAADQSGFVECCKPQFINTHLCFHSNNIKKKSACLPVRKLLSQSPTLCNTSTDCTSSTECFKPVLDNATRLLCIHRENKDDVIFVGSPIEVYKDVTVTSFKSAIPFISSRIFYMWETFLKYFVAVSGALSILNIIPCKMLDGQWIITALIDYLFSKRLSQPVRRLLCDIIITCGTVSLCACIMASLYSLVNKTVT